MAKKKHRRKRRARRSTAHLRKYQFKSKRRSRKRRSHAVAKRRRRRSTSSHRRRSPSRRRRSSGGGRARGLMPSREDTELMVGAAVIGYVEGKEKADATFFTNKLPRPVAALGATGNLALMLWLGAHFTKNKYLRIGARSAAMVAAYQIARQGKAFAAGTDHFTVSGFGPDVGPGHTEHIIDEASVGALAAEGDALAGDELSGEDDEDELSGVPYDDEVDDAGRY